MSLLLSLVAANLLQASAAPLPTQGWVWSLYDDSGPVVVLAEEVPDTPHLRATFECSKGSSQIKLTHYQAGAATTGPVSLSAGSAHEDAMITVEGPLMVLSMPARSAVFRNLVTSGQMNLTTGDQATDIRFDRDSLPQLRRFAQACTG